MLKKTTFCMNCYFVDMCDHPHPEKCRDFAPLYENVPDPEDYRDDFRSAWIEYCSEYSDGNFLPDLSSTKNNSFY